MGSRRLHGYMDRLDREGRGPRSGLRDERSVALAVALSTRRPFGVAACGVEVAPGANSG